MERVKAERPGFSYEIRDMHEVIPSMTDPEAPVVRSTASAIEKVLGVDGVIDAQQIAAARKRQANGPRDLRPVYAKIPRDDLLETYPNDAYRKLEAMIMAEKTHGTAAELAEAKRCLAEAIAHLERLRKDEAYRNEYVVRMNVRLHPVYSRLDYEVVSRPPYLLFVEKSGKRSENTVARYANTLTRLYEEFHRHLGKPLGLAPLETCAQPADRALKVFVFTNTEAFRRHQRHLHVALPPGVTSYYSARDRWIVLDAGEAPRRGMEDFPLRRLVHEGTHQLMHAYSKVTREKASGKAMEWEDVRYSKQLWLQEGPAELLAGAMRTDDEPWSLATPLWHRVAELIATRAADKSEFTLDEIFGMTGTLDLMRAVRTKSLDPSEHGRLSSLAYAQFWATTHHLWNFADGTYRDRLVAALRQELRGNSGPMIWVATWGGEGPVDWSGLEGEIRASVAAMGR